MEWQSGLGSFADIIGILGAVFALGAWVQTRRLQKQIRREEERMNQKITLILKHDDKAVELPFELRRAELTRAEILGLIGMIPMKEAGKRFSLGYLSEPKFLQEINQILQGADNAILVIPCTQAEIDQFDFQLPLP